MSMELVIVTPQKELLKLDCYMVTFESIEGQMGVIEGHSNMIVGVNDCDLLVFANEKDIIKTIKISSGFAEISAESIVFIVEEAEVLE
jgi:F0F1-type ATP synthase epsilon subunit